MVLLSKVHSSNEALASTFPDGLSAVFVGATSGIGEITLKKFAQYVPKPRAYIIGRSEAKGSRIMAECKALSPDGVFIFIKADVGLLREVDRVCEMIKQRETKINILFCTPGILETHPESAEKMNIMTCLIYYARMRFALNLLPLIQSAPHLQRVVSVFAGGKEGAIDITDFQARKLSFIARRNHVASLNTLGMETLAARAPTVSFIHEFPGLVHTPALSEGTTAAARGMNIMAKVLGRWICTPLDESGERHLFLATNAMYAPAKGDKDGVKEGVAKDTVGDGSTGVYSVDGDCEAAARPSLVALRNEGIREKSWEYLVEEFTRITGKVSL